jgi:hypothetical protein
LSGRYPVPGRKQPDIQPALRDRRVYLECQWRAFAHGTPIIGLERGAGQRGEGRPDRSAEHLFAPVMKQRLCPVVHEAEAPLRIQREATLRHALHDLRESAVLRVEFRFSLAQRVLGVPALGDVRAINAHSSKVGDIREQLREERSAHGQLAVQCPCFCELYRRRLQPCE